MEIKANSSGVTTSNLVPNSSCVVTFTPEGCFYGNSLVINYKPKRIVIDGKITACFFEDGEKIVVRCGEGDTFSEEVGVAEAIARKLYGNRTRFKKAIANAEHPAHPEKKKKKKLVK